MHNRQRQAGTTHMAIQVPPTEGCIPRMVVMDDKLI